MWGKSLDTLGKEWARLKPQEAETEVALLRAKTGLGKGQEEQRNAIAAAAFMAVGIAGWVNSNNRAFEAKASTLQRVRNDGFSEKFANPEFEDFSLVFSSRLHGQPSITP